MNGPIENSEDGIILHVKAVPGASRDQISGLLGDAIKIRVSAPPEDGRANRALCRLIADALGLPGASVSVLSGHGNPRKRIAVQGLDASTAAAKLKFG